ncbi:DUF2897 domain-containing protein [Vibrio sp. CK2-1]|uniref:DUF2897 domain-containing protein n=1 Tax=Vibrio sp. CK2-1 TaxID=2912249 RepID=UPI001F3F405A|nr:DUF2897 domain-containing protein [Vibrio sp. CK2-1]MCF7354352.1 DUF2897 domain-containing protein [Vibrio sp. CK2-1]
MDLDLLLNPWVISIIIIVFIIGNLASMKYLGQSHLVRKNPKAKSDLEKLIEIYKEKDQQEAQDKTGQKKKTDSDDTNP